MIVVVMVQMIEEFVRITVVVFVAHVGDSLPDDFDLRCQETTTLDT